MAYHARQNAMARKAQKDPAREPSFGRAPGVAAAEGGRTTALWPDERPQPAQGEIARLAYELYQKRGETHGDDLSDWFNAEAILKESLGGGRGLLSPRQGEV